MILPQIISIGVYNSEIAERNVSTSKDRITAKFEIELPLEKGGISYIDSRCRPITPNMLICAKPNQHRHTKFPFRCYYMHMTVEDEKLNSILQNAPDFLEMGSRDVYERIFKALIQHSQSGSEHKQIMLQSLILELIYTIAADSVKPCFGSANMRNYLTVKQAMEYIEHHLTEELKLEDLAKQFSLSSIYFHNSFKTVAGKTLRAYIEDRRLTKAVNLLMTTNLSLTEIAYECGFSSQSYFSYVFKRRMNTTPRAYVKSVFSKYEI